MLRIKFPFGWLLPWFTRPKRFEYDYKVVMATARQQRHTIECLEQKNERLERKIERLECRNKLLESALRDRIDALDLESWSIRKTIIENSHPEDAETDETEQNADRENDGASLLPAEPNRDHLHPKSHSSEREAAPHRVRGGSKRSISPQLDWD